MSLKRPENIKISQSRDPNFSLFPFLMRSTYENEIHEAAEAEKVASYSREIASINTVAVERIKKELNWPLESIIGVCLLSWLAGLGNHDESTHF